MANPVVVVIHGVGEAKPGETVEALAQALGPELGVVYVPTQMTVGGTPHASRVPVTPGAPDLVEVNWSDLKLPPKTLRGFLAALAATGLAMLSYRPDDDFVLSPGHAPRLRTQTVFRLLLDGAVLWTAFPVFVCIGWATPSPNHWSLSVGAVLVYMALMTVAACRWRLWPLVAGGVMWTVATAAIASALSSASDVNLYYFWTARVYGGSQSLAGVTLVVALLEALVRSRGHWRVYLSLLALCYLPLVVLSVLGGCLWVAVLAAAHARGGPSRAWSGEFLRGLTYDLQWGEWGVAGAVVAMVALSAVALLRYRLAPAVPAAGRPAGGAVARRWLDVMLVVMPLLLAVPGVAMAVTSPWGPRPANVGRLLDVGVLAIYGWASVRLIGPLSSLAGRAAVVLDVLGDVTYYVCQPETGLSTRHECRKRLQVVLRDLWEQGRRVCVVAHSQGSVIAYDVLRDEIATSAASGATQGLSDTRLVTMGSPLGTLYGRLLGKALTPLPGIAHWKNLYREGDYIGGPVHIGKADVSLGAGGHTGYWGDAAAAKHICACF
jgi:hypothetical protein